MTNKHTPGPWRWGIDFNGLSGPRKGMEVLRFQMYEGMWLEYGEFQEANARLIAASPDLLEALENLMDAYSEPDDQLCCSGTDCGCMGATRHQQSEHYARAAIAKARGDQP